MNPKSLCATCVNCSERVVETFDTFYDYKQDGKCFNYEYACSLGHKLYSYQFVKKCTGYFSEEELDNGSTKKV